MCDIYYLDHFRPDVADARVEAEEVNKKIDVAEDAMDQLLPRANLDVLSERLAKIMLDTAFLKIDQASSLASRERLLRYAVEQCRKLKHDLDIELNWAAVIKEKLEGGEDD